MLTNELMACFRITEQYPRIFRKIPKRKSTRLAHRRGFAVEVSMELKVYSYLRVRLYIGCELGSQIKH